MRNDYVDVRTPLLDVNAVYFINVYIASKGEEMSLGLFEKDAYSPAMWPLRTQRAVQYYGGDNRYNGTDTGKIWANGGQVVDRVKGFFTGDWVTIHVDCPSKKIVFYKNGNKIYELGFNNILEGECCFWTFVDVRKDKLFIEQSPTLDVTV